MRSIPLVVALLVAAPAFGQSRVYTNADLGKPLPGVSTVTPAEAAALLAPRQFVYVAPRPAEPQVVLIASSPTAGPFGEFTSLSPSRRLDGSSYQDPQWESLAYSGRRPGSGRNSRGRRSSGNGWVHDNASPAGTSAQGAVSQPAPHPSPVAVPPPVGPTVPPPVASGFPSYRQPGD